MSLRRRWWYWRRHHELALGRPTAFTAKVNWRILHDRRAVLEGTCDKMAMKAFAQQRAGHLVRVPRTLWAGTDLHELARVALPQRWVLKPNHSTNRVHLGTGRPDPVALGQLTRGWLEEDLATRTGEWAYASARPLLVVEEFIDAGGVAPDDFKVYVFDGVPRLVQVHSSRFEQHLSRVYTTDWQPRMWPAGYPFGPDVPEPKRSRDMFEAAALIGAGFDMLRVDFYETGDELWFGEITPYPGSGMIRIDPAMDAELGRWWHLPERTTGGQRLVPVVGDGDGDGADDVSTPPRVA